MRRRGDLSGWILMGFLFVGAMALIFYILLLRAQHLARMEEQRENPEPEARVEQVAPLSSTPVIMAATPSSSGVVVPHMLAYA